MAYAEYLIYTLKKPPKTAMMYKTNDRGFITITCVLEYNCV